jgi:hypothetical protein
MIGRSWPTRGCCLSHRQIADRGDGLQILLAAASILNKGSRIVDKGWSSSLKVGRGANNSSPSKNRVTKCYIGPPPRKDPLDFFDI